MPRSHRILYRLVFELFVVEKIIKGSMGGDNVDCLLDADIVKMPSSFITFKY